MAAGGALQTLMAAPALYGLGRGIGKVTTAADPAMDTIAQTNQMSDDVAKYLEEANAPKIWGGSAYVPRDARAKFSVTEPRFDASFGNDNGRLKPIGAFAGPDAGSSAASSLTLTPPKYNANGSGMSQIVKDGQPAGYVQFSVKDGKATIHDIKTHEGSNSLGVGGVRDLLGAFRQIAPDVTSMRGVREPTMKTGPTRQGADQSGYGEREQFIDMPLE
jgi:hypothetical protein